MDIDEDGRDDVIFGIFHNKFFHDVMQKNTKAKMKKMCLDAGKMYL